MPLTDTGDARWRVATAGLTLFAVATLLAVHLLLSRWPQNQAFHAFCDNRRLLGMPNLLNVASNLPFLLIGAAGLAWLRGAWQRLDPGLGPCYGVFFVGLAATAFGSAYYHWAPDDAGLFWDRLPIAVAFMGLYTAVLAERVHARAAQLLWPLVLVGVASVVWWRLADDLRLYGVVQFFPVLTIPVILGLYRARWTHGAGLLVAIGCYVIGKLLEDGDLRVYQVLGQTVSGHTLKHLAAAAGAWAVYRMLVTRRRIG